mgnify:CR=1 FL=1
MGHKLWKTCPLGEVAEVTAGDPAPQGLENFDPAGIPFVRMQDVGRYGRTTSLADVKDRVSLETSKRLKLFRAGSILVPKSGASIRLNHRAILATDAHVVSHLAVISAKAEVDNRFLFYWLCSQDLSSIAHDADLPSLKTSELARLIVPLPPLSEQERLVRLLDEAETLRRLRARTDERTAELIPAIFHEMFESSYSFTKFKLSDVCEFITKGTTPKSSDIKDEAENDDIPFLKVYHITDDGAIDFDTRPSFISQQLHNGPLSRSKVFPNDILMNIVGPPLGKIGIVPNNTYTEWNVNQAIAIFRAKSKLEPEYLLYALRSPNFLNTFLSKAVGVRQLNLSLAQCREAEILVPSLSIQREFAARVAEGRAMEEKQAQSQTRLEALFDSMLARAFAGEL